MHIWLFLVATFSAFVQQSTSICYEDCSVGPAWTLSNVEFSGCGIIPSQCRIPQTGCTVSGNAAVTPTRTAASNTIVVVINATEVGTGEKYDWSYVLDESFQQGVQRQLNGYIDLPLTDETGTYNIKLTLVHIPTKAVQYCVRGTYNLG